MKRHITWHFIRQTRVDVSRQALHGAARSFSTRQSLSRHLHYQQPTHQPQPPVWSWKLPEGLGFDLLLQYLQPIRSSLLTLWLDIFSYFFILGRAVD